MEKQVDKEIIKKIICDFIDSLDYISGCSINCATVEDGSEGEYLKYKESTDKSITVYGVREV